MIVVNQQPLQCSPLKSSVMSVGPRLALVVARVATARNMYAANTLRHLVQVFCAQIVRSLQCWSPLLTPSEMSSGPIVGPDKEKETT